MKKIFFLMIAITIFAANLYAPNIQYYYTEGAFTRQKQMADAMFYSKLTPAQKMQFDANQAVTLTPQQKTTLGVPATVTKITKMPPAAVSQTKTTPIIGRQAGIATSTVKLKTATSRKRGTKQIAQKPVIKPNQAAVTPKQTITTPTPNPTVAPTTIPSWKPIKIEYKEKKPIAEEYLKSFLGPDQYAKFQAGQEVSIEGKQKLLGFPEDVKTIKKSQ